MQYDTHIKDCMWNPRHDAGNIGLCTTMEHDTDSHYISKNHQNRHQDIVSGCPLTQQGFGLFQPITTIQRKYCLQYGARTQRKPRYTLQCNADYQQSNDQCLLIFQITSHDQVENHACPTKSKQKPCRTQITNDPP